MKDIPSRQHLGASPMLKATVAELPSGGQHIFVDMKKLLHHANDYRLYYLEDTAGITTMR
jgi:hypothetical protein